MGHQPKMNAIVQGDCIEILGQWPEPVADLVFADPPFNIGYTYDAYDDNVDADEYEAWSRVWMKACAGVLKPHGSFYIAIGDDYAAQVRLIGRDLGLELRNWIVWSYTFGQNTKTKFARSHTHILYFVKDKDNFVFNGKHICFPSARHTEYNDKRAAPWGRVPDDTWSDFPRVCGTFKERAGWHGCQMPEALLMRIIRASTNPGDVVLDPFAGSGTTPVSAAKLGRQYVGLEISQGYVEHTRKRLAEAKQAQRPAAQYLGWSRLQVDTLASMYRETNTALSNLAGNGVAMDCFTRLLNVRLGAKYTVDEVIDQLNNLEKRKELPRLRNDRVITPRQRRVRKAV